MFVMTKDPKNAKPEGENIQITFEKGIPVKLVNLDTKESVSKRRRNMRVMLIVFSN